MTFVALLLTGLFLHFYSKRYEKYAENQTEKPRQFYWLGYADGMRMSGHGVIFVAIVLGVLQKICE